MKQASMGFPYFLDRDTRLSSELRRGYQARVVEGLLHHEVSGPVSPYAIPDYIAGRDYEVGRDC